MNLDGYMERVNCPILMLTGEYDHRDPLDEVYRLFDQLVAPAELWVFADQFHQLRFGGGVEVYNAMLDWLVDRVDGKPMDRAGAVLYIEPGSDGPDSPTAYRKRRWFEAPAS